MEENVNATNVENLSVSSSPDDNMITMLIKLVFVVLIGGVVTKLIKKFVNYIKEGKRLRDEEKQRKNQKEFDELVEKKAQEKLDTLLAKQVESKEEKTEENK